MARKELPEQDCEYRTARIRELGQNRSRKQQEKGQPEQDS
jgi:hypothetical protein